MFTVWVNSHFRLHVHMFMLWNLVGLKTSWFEGNAHLNPNAGAKIDTEYKYYILHTCMKWILFKVKTVLWYSLQILCKLYSFVKLFISIVIKSFHCYYSDSH